MLYSLESIRQPLYLALAQGRYEDAFRLLKQLNEGRSELRASVQLQLAELYALYGQDGLAGGTHYLHEARVRYPELTKDPLYRALYWEFAAYRGEPSGDIQRGVKAVLDLKHPIAAFHCACALIASRSEKEAQDILSILAPSSLPNYLAWRRWSLLGKSYEGYDWQAAVEAYDQALQAAQGEERQKVLLQLSNALLEHAKPVQALETLALFDTINSLDVREQARHAYLKGRAQFVLGNISLALEQFWHAERFESLLEEASFDVKRMLAKSLLILGQQTQAFLYYREALTLAEDEASQVKHELAYALAEEGYLLEAQEVYLEIIQDEHYSFRAEITASLADLERCLGNAAEAETLACRALDLGATVPACLCLGHLALSSFRFDTAIEYFEQALGDSAWGSSKWVLAHQLLADTYAQQGYLKPEQVIRHAEAARAYLLDADEWVLILDALIVEAKLRLGGQKRWLN